MKLEGPVGFWIINFVGVDYNINEVKDFKVLNPESVTGHNGENLKDLLSENDGEYYEMPTTEYWADLVFEAPKLKNNMSRSVFVKSSGYYKIHVDPVGEPQTDLVNYMIKTPGAYGQYTLKKLDSYVNSAISQLNELEITGTK